jgi:hypothetical protein
LSWLWEPQLQQKSASSNATPARPQFDFAHNSKAGEVAESVGEDVVCTRQVVTFECLTRTDKLPASVTKNYFCNCLPWYLQIMKWCNEYITSFTVINLTWIRSRFSYMFWITWWLIQRKPFRTDEDCLISRRIKVVKIESVNGYYKTREYDFF